MKHNLRVSVSKTPQMNGLVSCRNVTVRERFLRFLFGDKQHITVLIPGDTVEELTICDAEKGGNDHEQSAVT